MKIVLAKPRGFCAGVDRAIQIVERALQKFGSPLYVRHEIVHNKAVVNDLRAKGVRFVEELDDVPEGAVVVFSAHGVGESVYAEAKAKRLVVIDAACPLVKKVHNSAKRHDAENRTIILIGHAGHPEVVGTMGQIKGKMLLVTSPEDVARLEVPAGARLAYITQTTFSIKETKGTIDALRERFPDIVGPQRGDMCYATTNRQQAVEQLCERIDLLLVVGSATSSNSMRLKELGRTLGVKSHLIDNCGEIDLSWFDGVERVGISSGASAPEHLVQEVIAYLQSRFPVEAVEELSILDENIHFSLPEILRD